MSANNCRIVYERHTRWMTDKQKEWFDKIVYLNPITKSRLETLFPDQEASEVWSWFVHESSIRDRSGDFRVMAPVRDFVLKYFEFCDPEDYSEKLAKAKELDRKVKPKAITQG